MHERADIYRLILTIHGRVQGVFFREQTCKLANRLGLVGEVENTGDGTVKVVAEGSKAKLAELKSWCQRGPKFAEVKKIDESMAPIIGFTFSGFSCIFH